MMVTEFREIGGFREFNLCKKKNTYSICKFTAGKGTYQIQDEIFQKSLKIFDCEKTDSPSADCLLMTGNLQSIKSVEGYREDLISATILSKAVRLEEKKYTRIFQSTEKTYRSILNHICDDNEFEIIFLNEDFAENRIEMPIIQLNETDMELICRIASQMNTSVWIDDKSDGICQIRIGDKRGNSVIELGTESLTVFEKEYSKDLEKVRIQIDRTNKLLKVFDIGKVIRIAGKDYIIEEIKIVKQNQVYRYECLAIRKRKKHNAIKKNIIEKISVHHFVGKVTNNQDPESRGRVQVDFNVEEVQDIADNYRSWIDVETIYDGKQGGVIFLPDIGDWVDVLWNGRELLVTGVRRREAISEEYQNLERKYIVDALNRNICFAQEGLMISSGDSEIFVNEDKVEVKNGSTGIVITDGRIHMDTDKKLECNVSKEIIMEGNRIELKGSTITINGEKRVEIN